MAIKVLEKIPANELVLLDKDLPDFKNECLTVYQDFEKDVSTALEDAHDLLTKYERIILVFPSDENYPIEIVRGVRFYCNYAKKEFVFEENPESEILQTETAYVVVEETDLAELIKKVR